MSHGKEKEKGKNPKPHTRKINSNLRQKVNQRGYEEMKNFIDMNWFMLRFSLVLSLSCFILTGFDFMAFGLILMVMLISLIASVLFWEKDREQ